MALIKYTHLVSCLICALLAVISLPSNGQTPDEIRKKVKSRMGPCKFGVDEYCYIIPDTAIDEAVRCELSTPSSNHGFACYSTVQTQAYIESAWKQFLTYVPTSVVNSCIDAPEGVFICFDEECGLKWAKKIHDTYHPGGETEKILNQKYQLLLYRIGEHVFRQAMCNSYRKDYSSALEFMQAGDRGETCRQAKGGPQFVQVAGTFPWNYPGAKVTAPKAKTNLDPGSENGGDSDITGELSGPPGGIPGGTSGGGPDGRAGGLLGGGPGGEPGGIVGGNGVPNLFGKTCALEMSDYGSCMFISYGTTDPELGLANGCLNQHTCSTASMLALILGPPQGLAMTQLYLTQIRQLLKDRYKNLREKMMEKLMRQIGTILAPELANCENDSIEIMQLWVQRASTCEGIDGAKIATQAFVANDRNVRAICQDQGMTPGNANGSITRRRENMRKSARELAVARCAEKLALVLPSTGSSTEHFRQVELYSDAYQATKKQGCKDVMTEAENLFLLMRPLGSRLTYSTEVGSSGKDERTSVTETLSDIVACAETEADPRLLELDREELTDIVGKRTSPNTVFGRSEAYKDFYTVFQRVCASGDEDWKLGNHPDTPHEGIANIFGRPLDTDEKALTLDELEDLVGNSVPEVAQSSYLASHYQTIKQFLTNCQRENVTKGTLEKIAETLERVCGVVTKATIAVAITGPQGAIAASVADTTCALPAVLSGALASSRGDKLTTYRRALGNQMSCTQASSLREQEKKLHGKLSSSLVSAALTLTIAVPTVIGSARTIAEAEAALAREIRLVEGAAARRTQIMATTELSSMDSREISRLARGIEMRRPVRTDFPDGSAGNTAFEHASTAFESSVAIELKAAKIKNADAILAKIQAPAEKSIGKKLAEKELVPGGGGGSSPGRTRVVQTTTRARALELTENRFLAAEIDFASARAHIVERHGPDALTPGGHFTRPVEEVEGYVQKALKERLPAGIQYDKFGRAELTLDLVDAENRAIVVGNNGVLSTEEAARLFPNAHYGVATRDGVEVRVLLVDPSEIQRAGLTNRVTVIIEQTENGPRVVTMFPGENAPALRNELGEINPFWNQQGGHLFVEAGDPTEPLGGGTIRITAPPEVSSTVPGYPATAAFPENAPAITPPHTPSTRAPAPGDVAIPASTFRSDALARAPPNVDFQVARMEPCCAPIPSVPVDQRALFAPGTYPYTSGLKRSTGLPNVPGLSVEIPPQLTGSPVSMDFFAIPNADEITRLQAALRPGETYNVLAPPGGSAFPYRIFPPGGKAPYVLKVRYLKPGQSVESAAAWAQRDIAVEGLAERLTAKATLNGKPFVRVAKNLGTTGERSIGIFKQELIEGPTVLKLQDAVDVALNQRVIPGMTTSKAQEILKNAGMTAEQAQAQIKAIERFYAETHNDVVKFVDQNRLVGLRNHTRDTGLQRVGLDYNHGVNAIWSSKEKKFVLIDW
ncbi:MAG: hypothetical protein A2X86_21795 [Bdellovibrionales bacterium GWA2_49_15]|nr:MAG: hypothetical protein A2X86_21795 [Bdellovibrionales bacterium GWA2_49_15]HAZ12848.1 hypothetical protein [Bdellovibrionales bacterium]